MLAYLDLKELYLKQSISINQGYDYATLSRAKNDPHIDPTEMTV